MQVSMSTTLVKKPSTYKRKLRQGPDVIAVDRWQKGCGTEARRGYVNGAYTYLFGNSDRYGPTSTELRTQTRRVWLASQQFRPISQFREFFTSQRVENYLCWLEFLFLIILFYFLFFISSIRSISRDFCIIFPSPEVDKIHEVVDNV